MTYKLKKDGFKDTLYQEYRLYNGTQDVGWMLLWKGRLPFVHITAKAHKIDKYAIAKAVKELEPDSWGEYFLIGELVHFEDFYDKEFLKKFDEEGIKK
jgi:hypothetical protein